MHYMDFSGFEGGLLGLIASDPNHRNHLIRHLRYRSKTVAYCIKDIKSGRETDRYDFEIVQAAKGFIDWADKYSGPERY